MNSQEKYHAVTIFIGFFLLFYLPKLLFMAFNIHNDVTSLLAKGGSYLVDEESKAGQKAETKRRTDFLLKAGLILAAVPFISILYGMAYGKFNFKIQKVKLTFPDLPASFDGLKIIQISDLHLGSFNGNTQQVENAIKMVNEQKADYILFTGDMVNTKADEMESYIPVLKTLTAGKGKFSILGNHDYGDYHTWNSAEEKKENLQRLFKLQEEADLRLLRNEAVVLEKNNEKIALIGVENWGLPPFPQYGNLEKAMANVKDIPFKILMSHDPSHWDAEVRPESDINLTLSGHTHGMQFAIRVPGWRWSPVKMKYPRWAGLYREGKQLLYVNIGLGFIAFPGRVGTPPEITVFELHKA
jgi:predicted MPP superfamily phosphohydrolase